MMLAQMQNSPKQQQQLGSQPGLPPMPSSAPQQQQQTNFATQPAPAPFSFADFAQAHSAQAQQNSLFGTPAAPGGYGGQFPSSNAGGGMHFANAFNQQQQQAQAGGYNGLPQMPAPAPASASGGQSSSSNAGAGNSSFMGPNGSGYPGMGGLSALAGLTAPHGQAQAQGSPSASSGPFGLPALPSAGVGADAVVSQHFGHQPSPQDGSNGKSGRGRKSGRSGVSRSNSINSQHAQAQQQMHQYIPYQPHQQQRGQFPPALQTRNSENDAEGEEEDGSGAGFLGEQAAGDDIGTGYRGSSGGGRGAPKRRAAQNASASLAALDNGNGEGSSGFDFDPSNLDFSASLAALAAAGSGDLPGASGGGGSASTGLGAKRGPASDLSSTISAEDEEWVAEASDDSYGRSRSAKKKPRKSYNAQGQGQKQRTLESQLHQGEAGSMFYAGTPTQGGGMPPLAPLPGTTSAPGVKLKRDPGSRPAAPGSGNIVCDFVDPSTGIKCTTRFRRPYDQARHMETVHKQPVAGADGEVQQPPKWSCNQCQKNFSRKDALIRHGRISNHQTM